MVYTGRGIALLALKRAQRFKPDADLSSPLFWGGVSGRSRASFHEAQARQKAQY